MTSWTTFERSSTTRLPSLNSSATRSLSRSEADESPLTCTGLFVSKQPPLSMCVQRLEGAVCGRVGEPLLQLVESHPEAARQSVLAGIGGEVLPQHRRPRLARALTSALRDRALELPDDDETRAEFLATRLVETGPSTVKLQNPPGEHDDIVAAVGMVAVDLTDQPEAGRGTITVPTGARFTCGLPSNLGARGGALPRRAQLRKAERTSPRIPGGPILMPGSANDPNTKKNVRGV